MNDEPERKRIFLGVIDDTSANVIVVPAAALRPAEAVFNAEREARLAAATKARLAVTQRASARAKLKRAIAACFGRGRRG
jgi:hypothetical protein